MQKYLLVDGYNIIFGWTELNKLAQKNLEHARDKLVEMLANHQGYIGEEIIIVFDAYNVKGQGEAINYNAHVSVIYTKEKETADQYIERTARVIPKKYKVRVATSDATEQVIVLGAGATRVSASELFEEMKVKKQGSKRYINTHKAVKNNPLENWMNEETLEKLERLRRGDVE